MGLHAFFGGINTMFSTTFSMPDRSPGVPVDFKIFVLFGPKNHYFSPLNHRISTPGASGNHRGTCGNISWRYGPNPHRADPEHRTERSLAVVPFWAWILCFFFCFFSPKKSISAVNLSRMRENVMEISWRQSKSQRNAAYIPELEHRKPNGRFF